MSILKSPLVSVIIPVYNAAETLDACLNSLCSQNYDPLQIILVNDGSADDSLAVIERLSKKDSRIEFYSQENQGCSAARNTALAHAKGVFYVFMDADDTMVEGALPKMLQAIYENDLLIAHYNFVVGKASSNRGLIQENATYNDKKFYELLLKQPGAFYYSALWNKLYRGDIIRENGIAFDQALTWGEDFAFNMVYYRYVHSVRLLPTAVYNYMKAPSGISVRALKHVAESCRIKWQLYLYFKALCVEKGLWEEQKARIRMYILNVTLND